MMSERQAADRIRYERARRDRDRMLALAAGHDDAAAADPAGPRAVQLELCLGDPLLVREAGGARVLQHRVPWTARDA